MADNQRRGVAMTDKEKELPQPKVVTYRREELEIPVAYTGEPSSALVF